MGLADIAAQFLGTLAGFAELYDVLVAWVTPLVLIGFTITIMWHGIGLMRGQHGLHVLDLFAKGLRPFLVLSLALTGGAYANNVVGIVTDLRNSLTALVAQTSPAGNSYEALDAIMEKGSEIFAAKMPWFWDHTHILIGDFTGLVAFGCMALVVGCMAIFALVSAGNLLYVDFALSFLFVMGPLFVACLAFQASARFFDTWLSGVLKYTFTAVVIAAVNGIALQILTNFSGQLQANAEKGVFLAAAIGTLCGFGLVIWMAYRVGELAADLVGGIGLSLASPSAAAPALAGAAAASQAAGRGAANAAAYGVGAAASTPVGQGIAKAAGAIANSSLGQRAIAASQSATRFAKATTNTQAGSVGAAYRAGAGTSAGTGTIRGAGGRPLTPPTR